MNTLKVDLDAELWEPLLEVPKEIQNVVNRIESGRHLAEALDSGSEDSLDLTGPRRHLSIAGRVIKVTKVSVTLLDSLYKYVQCASMFPLISYRAAKCTFDFLVFYDDRIRRLILGTEVKQKGRLQTINAKHLAMALERN